MDVLIQSGIEGVALNIAWPYLEKEQKLSFKQQARDIVRTLFSLKGPPQYIYQDENPVVTKRISQEEACYRWVDGARINPRVLENLKGTMQGEN